MSAIAQSSSSDVTAISDTQSDPDLKDVSSLLASRICHDLISPIGAISNGMELLVMSGLPPSPELALIEESIENANARVRFFRVAFGGATDSQKMSRTDALKLLSDCYKAGRVSVQWEPPSELSRVQAKLVLLGVLCLETALPAGGRISIQSERGQWQMQAYGDKIRFDQSVWSVLSGQSTAEVEPSQIQFTLMHSALDTLGATAQIGHSDSAVSLRYDL